MAVISVHEVWKGREADATLDDTRYTRVFRVWTNSGADDGSVILAALSASPWNVYAGALYPHDSNAFCVGAKPNNDLGNRGWLCTATYSTKREYEEQPENDPIEISWDEEDIEVPVVKRRDGKAVLNSAGDPPDPPLMASDSILIAKIQLKVNAVPAYLRSYRKAINSAAFTIDGLTVNAKRARIRKMSLGTQRFRNSFPYRDVNIELAILDNDEDDWELRFLDAGFRKKETIAGNVVRTKIVNADKTEPTAPVPLNGSGVPLANPTVDNAVFIEVPYYRLKTFAGNVPGCT